MEKLTKKERKELKKMEAAEKLEKENKQKAYKKIGLWAGLLIFFVLIVWGLIALVNTPAQQLTGTPLTTSDIQTGNPKTKVSLVEYADFECPACAESSVFVEQLRKDYPNDLREAFRFFPLEQHRYGMLTAQVAYAAYKQGKFWEMYRLLFDNQNTWVTSDNAASIFNDYATKLNLDMAKFAQDLSSDSTKKFINDEYHAGLSIGITSTPTFFLNGTLIQPKNYNEFKQLVENEIKK